MRKIKKQDDPPKCLQKFIDLQQQIGPPIVNLCYPNFQNPRKQQLKKHLTEEQFGICGYTGAPVDERIGNFAPHLDGIAYSNHIEHLKCQEACRAELEAAGLDYGCDLCDDLNYHNMIAALEIRGMEEEQFGAVYKKNNELPVWPTHDGCEQRFRFQEADGGVNGLDADAATSVEVLHLNHETLKGWRKAAIDSFLDSNVVSTKSDLQAVLDAVDNPSNGMLPEFSFAIASVARQYLQP